MATTLMSLPSEVRLIIIRHVIQSPSRFVPFCFSETPAPLTAQRQGLQEGEQGNNHIDQRAETDDVSYASWSRGEAIFYEKDPRAYDSNAWRLMNVNRQLYVEVKALIRSMSSWCAFRSAVATEAANNPPDDLANLNGKTDFKSLEFMGSENKSVVTSETEKRSDGDKEEGRGAGAGDEGSRINSKSSFVQYDLDILITQDGMMMPTWTWIPFKTTYIDELNISLRSMGTLNKWITDSAFWERQGGQNPSFGWLLCSLLERFLQVGASSPKESSTTTTKTKQKTSADENTDEVDEECATEKPPDDMEFCIGCVTIELEDPAQQQKHKDESSKREQENMTNFTEHVRNLAVRPLYANSQSATSTSGMSPETLANRIISRISELLSFSLYQFRDRLVFYERMTVIRFRFRDQTMCQWDLGHLLKPLHSRQLVFFHEQIIARRNDSGMLDWLRWSRRTADKRRKLGLLAPDLTVYL